LRRFFVSICFESAFSILETATGEASQGEKAQGSSFAHFWAKKNKIAGKKIPASSYMGGMVLTTPYRSYDSSAPSWMRNH